MKKIVHTVKGDVAAADLGLTLPHEHLLTDLRGPNVADYAQADADEVVAAMLALIEAGHEDRLLLSHDAGWYQPGAPSGQPDGGMRGYTALFEDFLPALRARGVGDQIVEQITVVNPARAFALAPV